MGESLSVITVGRLLQRWVIGVQPLHVIVGVREAALEGHQWVHTTTGYWDGVLSTRYDAVSGEH